ncbi:MAG: peptidoglycan editing factor PgeF [Betaproteobacteria bacterium]|nr:peptidoglycan editing factor PgeF [Betaproteobacteria bacterium]
MNEYRVDWPAPNWVKTFATVRQGGVSEGPWSSLNLGDHVGDVLEHVTINRQRVEAHIQVTPIYLKQVHGTTVVNLDHPLPNLPIEADAAFTKSKGKAAVVLTADCMPIFFCHGKEKVVAVAHAGWRGLAQGIIRETIHALNVSVEEILVWLGPTISQPYFEVGDEVKSIFEQHHAMAKNAFLPGKVQNKWYADLTLLAKQQLQELGVTKVYGGDMCNYHHPNLFFSHRRDQGVTGRMGYYIWVDSN